MKAGVEPGSGRDLARAARRSARPARRSRPRAFDWIYEHVGADTWLFSTSGGTDVCTAFVGGVPILPVYRGELQGALARRAVEAWDEDGEAVIDEVGELVITEPMPSMPVFLWGDDDGSRYRESYFEMYPGIWRHGDWIEITARGTAIIYGRSDSTINRGGVRMGTCEIYRAVAVDRRDRRRARRRHPAARHRGLDAAVRRPARGRRRSTTTLTKEIARRIREQCSPRHVPDEVFAIAEVPRTLSGKVLEVPVKRILMGTPAERRPAATRSPTRRRSTTSSSSQTSSTTREGSLHRPGQLERRPRRAVHLDPVATGGLRRVKRLVGGLEEVDLAAPVMAVDRDPAADRQRR